MKINRIKESWCIAATYTISISAHQKSCKNKVTQDLLLYLQLQVGEILHLIVRLPSFNLKRTTRHFVLLICTCSLTYRKHKPDHFLFLRGWKKDGTSIDVIADRYDLRRYWPIFFVCYILHDFRAFHPVSNSESQWSVVKGLVEDTKPVKKFLDCAI